MDLGVSNSVVRLVEHSSEWANAFNKEKERILKMIGCFSPVIEHIGSTSIEGLDSKPIIDIAVGIPSYQSVDIVIKALETAGYLSRGYRNDGLGTILELKENDLRTHCIHLLDMSKSYWDDCIFFRDQLRRSSALTTEYQKLKRELFQKYPNERRKYTETKNLFVASVLESRRQ